MERGSQKYANQKGGGKHANQKKRMRAENGPAAAEDDGDDMVVVHGGQARRERVSGQAGNGIGAPPHKRARGAPTEDEDEPMALEQLI